jgi:hypothetical protein
MAYPQKIIGYIVPLAVLGCHGRGVLKKNPRARATRRFAPDPREGKHVQRRTGHLAPRAGGVAAVLSANVTPPVAAPAAGGAQGANLGSGSEP